MRLLLLSLFALTSLSQAQPSDWLSRITNTEEHLIHREKVGPYLVNGDGQRLIRHPYLRLDIRHNGERIPQGSDIRVNATLQNYENGRKSYASYTPVYEDGRFVIDPLELDDAKTWSWDSGGYLALNLTIDGPAGEGAGELGFYIYPPKPEAGLLFSIVNFSLPFAVLGLFALIYWRAGVRLRQPAAT